MHRLHPRRRHSAASLWSVFHLNATEDFPRNYPHQRSCCLAAPLPAPQHPVCIIVLCFSKLLRHSEGICTALRRRWHPLHAGLKCLHPSRHNRRQPLQPPQLARGSGLLCWQQLRRPQQHFCRVRLLQFVIKRDNVCPVRHGAGLDRERECNAGFVRGVQWRSFYA